MKLFVVLNPHAGSGRRQEIGETADAVTAAFRRRGVETTLAVARGDRIAETIRDAGKGFDAVVIGGGDGSVSAAAGALADGDVPLGVLPLGTLNHFARDLRIPGEIDEAAAVVAAGRVARLDLGEVNGRVFVNNSSIGIYPYLVGERHQLRRQGLAGWAAIGIALARVLRHLPEPRVQVAAAGWKEAMRTSCLFVGNNFYQIDPLAAAGRSRIDRGELCLYVINCCGRAGLLRLAWRALLGRLEPASDLTLARLRELTVSSPHPRLRVALDGESLIMTPPLNYRVRAAALPVLIPETAL